MAGPLRRTTRELTLKKSQTISVDPITGSSEPFPSKNRMAGSKSQGRVAPSSGSPLSDQPSNASDELHRNSPKVVITHQRTANGVRASKANKREASTCEEEEEERLGIPPGSSDANGSEDDINTKSQSNRRTPAATKRDRTRRVPNQAARLPKQSRHRAESRRGVEKDKRAKQTDAGSDAQAVEMKREYDISQDNDLFNTIKRGPSAIEPTLEDWVEIYKGTGGDGEEAKGEGIALVITCVLRCCGCNNSIDKHEALDHDAAAGTLDDIQEQFKKVPNQTYPLIARSGKAVPKNFRKNLITLFHHLFKLAHSTSILYDEQFLNSLQSYLVSMSSSSLRSFRHTATFISLFGLVSSLCDILSEVSKELTSLSRKVEAETAKDRTKATGNPKQNIQLQQWEKRKREVHAQKVAIENHIGDLFDGVFIHRFRDADPNIRVDCVQALGQWMIKIPDYFLGGNYLRYIGWVLTDSNKDARFEALKALDSLYAKEDNVGAMQHFTSRFKARLVEMATGEPDMPSRCLAISIISMIDKHGLLESDHRNEMVRLIYHEDFRVRRAIGGFFSGVLQEAYDAKRIKMNVTQNPSLLADGKAVVKRQQIEEAEKRLMLKCLARLLIKCGRKRVLGVEDHDDDDDDASSEDLDDEHLAQGHSDLGADGLTNQAIGVGYVPNFPEKGRVALAVEYLWDEVEVLRDWQAMANFLLLDHSASSDKTARRAKLPNSRNRRISVARLQDAPEGSEKAEVMAVEETFALSETEENLLVEVFVAALRKASSVLTAEELAQQKKKKRKLNKQKKITMTDDESEESDEGLNHLVDEGQEDNTNKIEITRVMMKVLPKLYSKYSTDSVRLSEVLRIPKLMCLNLYLDLRMVSAYGDLWDVLTRQYIKQQVPQTIEVISSTIEHMLNSVKSLAYINEEKMKQLDEQLLGSLADSIQTKVDLETCTFEDHEIVSLNLMLLKIAHLIRQRDLTSVLGGDVTDEEPIESSKSLDLIYGLANRGRLSYREEAKMVEAAMGILQLHFMWACAGLCRLINRQDAKEADAPDLDLEKELTRILGVRDRLFALLGEYAIDPNCDACEEIKRAAFVHLLNAYLLCHGSVMPKALKMDCDEQTQYRCAGFMAAEIERFGAEMMRVGRRARSISGSEKEGETRMPVSEERTKNRLPDLEADEIPHSSVKDLKAQEAFDVLMATFTKAICCGLIKFQHASVILPHFTRFGRVFDLSLEVLVESLKSCLGNEPAQKGLLAKTISESLRESFELFQKEEVATEEQFIRLSKLLQSSIVNRGARLSIKPVLDPQAYVVLHTTCIEWVVKKTVDANSDATTKSAVMFKGLMNLILGLEGRAALKIKSAMDLFIQSYGLHIPATSKAWDPYRTYLRRLISIMAKDASIKRAAKIALKKQSGNESGAEDVELDLEPRIAEAEATDGPGSDKGDGLDTAKRPRRAHRVKSPEMAHGSRQGALTSQRARNGLDLGEGKSEPLKRPRLVRRAKSREKVQGGNRGAPASQQAVGVPKLSAPAKGKVKAVSRTASPASNDRHMGQTPRGRQLQRVLIPASTPSRSLSGGSLRASSLVSVVIPSPSHSFKRKRLAHQSHLSSSIGMDDEEEEEEEAADIRDSKKRRTIGSAAVGNKKDKREPISDQAEEDVNLLAIQASGEESEVSLAEIKRRKYRIKK